MRNVLVVLLLLGLSGCRSIISERVPAAAIASCPNVVYLTYVDRVPKSLFRQEVGDVPSTMGVPVDEIIEEISGAVSNVADAYSDVELNVVARSIEIYIGSQTNISEDVVKEAIATFRSIVEEQGIPGGE